MENTNNKIYTFFAGINGAGKSTLYYALGSHGFGERLNSDELMVEKGKDWKNYGSQIRTGIEIIKKQNDYFSQGLSINRETTLSEGSILKFIEKLKGLGYEIHMYYVGLENLDIAKERIAKRVSEGGHGIDNLTLSIRHKALKKNLKNVIKECDLVQLYDNSGESLKFVGFKNQDGSIYKSTEDCKWLNNLVSEYEKEILLNQQNIK